MSSEFDTKELFDEDYLYFYEPLLSDRRAESETDSICSLGPINPGDRVLDLACGHGRIANRLADRGARVTGFDLTSSFLQLAREDARKRGVTVEYVQGDMANLTWSDTFDLVINWFTAFGYSNDVESQQVLEAIRRCLKPRGRLLLELNHGPALLAGFREVDGFGPDGAPLTHQARRMIVRGVR